MDVLCCDQESVSLDIGKSCTRLMVGIACKEYMFWIVSRCLHMHLHEILNDKVVMIGNFHGL